MRLEQLEYILAIYEQRSINKAAKKLFISPQTLSASLASLEEELGFDIFIRNSKGVSLTYQGQQIIADTQNVIDTLRNWQKIAINPLAVSGSIKISCSAVFNYLFSDLIIFGVTIPIQMDFDPIVDDGNIRMKQTQVLFCNLKCHGNLNILLLFIEMRFFYLKISCYCTNRI